MMTAPCIQAISRFSAGGPGRLFFCPGTGFRDAGRLTGKPSLGEHLTGVYVRARTRGDCPARVRPHANEEPMAKNLLIVESPAKAKTINKYLGKDFDVLASYGHIRDLVAKEGAVDPDNGFAMRYEVDGDSEKRVDAIAKAAAKASALYLATDLDREGESISWHIVEVLRERGLLDGKTLHRVVFSEITPKAIREAVANPRDISMDLVNAQQARRALDHLVGFT